MATILKVNPTPSIEAYLLEEQSCQISSQSDLKDGALGLFEHHCPNNKQKKNKMSRDMGSVPDPTRYMFK